MSKKIKKLVGRPIKELRILLLSFNKTQSAALHNNNIMASFDGHLNEEIKYPKGSPLDYGSEFWDPTGIERLFSHHEDKNRIVDMIQKRVPIPPVNNLRGNQEI